MTHIAMLRQALVEGEQWIDRSRFNKLLAIPQALPRPETDELCVHFGIMARGRIGGLSAGLGFMLPGLVLMLFAGWISVTWIAQHQMWAGPLLGNQVAVLAIILRAVCRIGEHMLIDRLAWVIALVSALIPFLGVPFGCHWLLLAGFSMPSPTGLMWLLRRR